MKFYKPQVQLVRQRIDHQPDEYFLHAITFCEYTNIRANGHETLLPTLNKDGKYEVTLLAIEDAKMPKFNYLTPIVHTISLGRLPFEDKEGDVLILLKVISSHQKSSGDAGRASVSTASAEEMGRPIFVES